MSNLDGSKWNRWPTYQSKGKPRTYLKSYAHPSSLVHHPVLLTVTEPVEHPMASVCTQCLLAKGGDHFLLSWWVSDEASWDSSGSTKSQARITHNNQIHPNPWYGFCTQTWSFLGIQEVRNLSRSFGLRIWFISVNSWKWEIKTYPYQNPAESLATKTSPLEDSATAVTAVPSQKDWGSCQRTISEMLGPVAKARIPSVTAMFFASVLQLAEVGANQDRGSFTSNSLSIWRQSLPRMGGVACVSLAWLGWLLIIALVIGARSHATPTTAELAWKKRRADWPMLLLAAWPLVLNWASKALRLAAASGEPP